MKPIFIQNELHPLVCLPSTCWNHLKAASNLSLSVAPCCSSSLRGLHCDKRINSKEFKFQIFKLDCGWFSRTLANAIQRHAQTTARRGFCRQILTQSSLIRPSFKTIKEIKTASWGPPVTQQPRLPFRRKRIGHQVSSSHFLMFRLGSTDQRNRSSNWVEKTTKPMLRVQQNCLPLQTLMF